MGAYGAIIGGAIGSVGTFLASQEARKQKNQLKDLANTPGLDIDTEVANALASYEKSLPGAQQLAGGINQGNAASLREMLGLGIPGYEALQAQDIANIQAEQRGQLSPEVMGIIQRATAARAGQGGYLGSPMQFNAEARNLGESGQALQAQGHKDYLSLLAGTPLPGLVGSQAFLGPSISDRLGIRSNERTQKLGLMSKSILSPSDMAVISQFLVQQGATLQGAGMSSMGGGADFSSGSGMNVQPGGAGLSSQFGG